MFDMLVTAWTASSAEASASSERAWSISWIWQSGDAGFALVGIDTDIEGDVDKEDGADMEVVESDEEEGGDGVRTPLSMEGVVLIELHVEEGDGDDVCRCCCCPLWLFTLMGDLKRFLE